MALPTTFLRLQHYIRKEKIDLVHTHSPLDTWLAGTAAHLTARQSVRTLHIGGEMPPKKRSKPLFNWLTSGIIPTSPVVVSQMNEADKALCSSLPMGIDASQIIPSDQQRKKFRQKLGLTPLQFVVGACSTEGIETLFQAARHLRAHQSLRWIVAANGARYEGLLKKLGLQGRVLFTGELTDPSEALQAVDVALFLSSCHHELNPLALRAACLGLPLLTTRVSGLLEVCIDYRTGHTMEACEPTQIADHVLRLMDDPRGRRRLGDAARQRVLQKFTTEHTFDQLEEIYAKMLCIG
jgi:glycosyltransferase involved in cell wall biosynthesis